MKKSKFTEGQIASALWPCQPLPGVSDMTTSAI